MLVGLFMLPLSMAPFAVYLRATPEGRLLWTRATLRFSTPELPRLDPAEARRLRADAPRYRGGVAVLVYHGLGSSTDGEGRFTIPVSRFAEHLNALRAAGFRFVTASEVARAFSARRPLPDNAVMLTFDDGRAEAMMLADPLLRQAGARATMFVITDRTEDPGLFYASRDALRRYAASGRWDLQSHTARLHDVRDTSAGELPLLTSRADGETLPEYRRRVAADLDRADRSIAELSGRAPVAFAYPFGAYGADRSNDPRIRTLLAGLLARRYRLAFQQDDQPTVPLLTCRTSRMTARRLEVGAWSGTELLRRLRAMVRRTPRARLCG
jgi:peptidoglycan/xylan/chitin deacetylase (PgdA/CDA1 family)